VGNDDRGGSAARSSDHGKIYRPFWGGWEGNVSMLGVFSF